MNTHALVLTAFILSIGTTCGSKKTAPMPVGIEIVVPETARDMITMYALRLPLPQRENRDLTASELTWTDAGKGLPSLFAGRRIRRISVVRYSGLSLTSKAVRARLFELTRHRVEEPIGAIRWAEANNWNVEARIEFVSGSSVRIFTDGAHVCLFDTRGQPWFFRIDSREFQNQLSPKH